MQFGIGKKANRVLKKALLEVPIPIEVMKACILIVDMKTKQGFFRLAHAFCNTCSPAIDTIKPKMAASGTF